MTDAAQTKTLPDRLRALINDAPRQVWTPADFADIGGRDAIDKALQRMVTSGQLRRIERGFYDKPFQNALAGQFTVPDYRFVIDAIARRDKVRWLIDGMTAANTLGLTSAVPAKNRSAGRCSAKTRQRGESKNCFQTCSPKPALLGRATWHVSGSGFALAP